ALASVANDAAGRPIEAIARAALGHAYRREARLDASEREVLASAAAYRALGDDEGLCAMVFEAAVLSLFRRRYDEARARFDEAEAIARRLGARHREAAIHTARGTMEQELGNVDRARELHEAALETFRDVGSAYHEASTLYYLAGAHLERGQLEDADAIFARALAQVRAIGVPRYEALILGARATLAAHAGRTREAEALLGEADAAALRCASEPALLAALAIHRLSLVSARDRDGAAARARELAAAHDCDDPRFALRAFSLRPISSTARALEIDEGGRAFRLPDADAAVDLARRVPLARILHALAQRRVEVPGDAMRVEDLLAAGWPGERVRYDAGANRVYVALAELRKLGLRDWIVSDAAGWRLATSRPVTLRAT
ncbi:MAG TPA: tetratricopeptide repeat protein, partial [Labilithrix sp.]